jgi:hypothetical protein
MSGDDEAGMAWWNALTERERAKWSAMSGNTGRAIDAWQAFKRASMTGAGAPRELTPQEVLADLLGSGDFPAEVIDPEGAAEIILRRLDDAGFKVVPAARLWAIVTGITS